jgi:hypothetical protein
MSDAWELLLEKTLPPDADRTAVLVQQRPQGVILGAMAAALR